MPEKSRGSILRDAALEALAHVLELEEAWQRGVLRELDGLGGTRSNRNVVVRTLLSDALSNKRLGECKFCEHD